MNRLISSVARRFSIFSATNLKAVRELTGAPISKCKEALDKSTSLELAVEYLKERNLSFAQKKEDKETKEGFFSIQKTPAEMIALSLLCETDFVARNEAFLDFVQQASKLAASNKVCETQQVETLEHEGHPLSHALAQMTGKFQEKIKFGHLVRETLRPDQTLGLYVHNGPSETVGNAMSYVVLKSDNKAPEVQALADELAVHVFCRTPEFLAKSEVSEAKIAEIKTELESRMKGKPQAAQEKAFEAKINDFFANHVLSEQEIEFGEAETVSKELDLVGKQVGTKIEIEKFAIHKIKGN